MGDDDKFLGFEDAQARFASASQNARIWTETWVGQRIYCPNCGSATLSKFANNSPVADFACATCAEEFELKSQKLRIGAKVVDGAYRTMMERMASTNNPNLILMSYHPVRLAVTNLLVVPKHFFVPEIIERRKPLADTARRAGWVGCNILLNAVPDAGKIFLVRNGDIAPKETVLAQWRRTLFLRDEKLERRGWLIEVMKCVEMIGREEFTLADVFAFEDRLSRIYPDNNNVRPKIRQQLQVLRDKGYLTFVGRGDYRLTTPL